MKKNYYKTKISIDMPSETPGTHTDGTWKEIVFFSHFSPCYGVTLTLACARVGGYRNMRPETLEIR